MTESQSSICSWADATFGLPVSDVSIAARALHEMAELVTACVYGEPAEKIGKEIADVVIVLARLGRALDADIIEVISCPPWTSPYGIQWHVARATSHLADALRAETDEQKVQAIGYALGGLSAIASALAIDLPAAIDAKMAINRARRWNVDGRGHGEHVKEKP